MDHPPADTRAARTTTPAPASTDRLVAEAVRDNAEWCALFARAHGIAGVIDDDAWTSPSRTPPGYPDAVTLRPGVEATDVLARIDTATEGCSIKDSYSDLDLSPYGFRELFRASWISCPPRASRAEAVDGSALGRVTDADELRAWEAGWGHSPAQPRFRAGLLEAPEVSVLAVREGPEVVAGAILTRFGDDVVGVSNVFAPQGDVARVWSGILEWTAEHHPGVPLVGYESGADLTAALRAGFRELGSLRVWIAEG